MILIIYLDLLDNKFFKYGFKDKQPFIKIFGKSIIEWIIDFINIKKFSNIIVIYNNDIYEYDLKNKLKKYNLINFIFSKIENDSNIIESLFNTLSYISDIDNESIIYIDSKYFYLESLINKKEEKDVEKENNKIFYINQQKIEDNNNIFIIETNNKSFYLTDSLSNNSENINNKVSIGSFMIKNCKDIKFYCKKLIEYNKILFLKNNLNITQLINLMLINNEKFILEELFNETTIYLNDPFHIRLFCNNFPRINAYDNSLMITSKKICFEIENTLIYFESDTIYYPLKKNIDYLNYLKKIGNQITLYTNISENIILNILIDLKINYDKIYYNKPDVDFFFLSNSVILDESIEKQLGFYNNKIDTRDFNQLSSIDLKKYKKISNDLSGEIYYYKNIPNEIKDIFPILYNYDIENKWFEIENINGITVSHLYLNEELTIKQFDNIIGTLQRIHNCNHDIQNINIYENYNLKLKDRIKKYDYSIFHNNDILYDFLYNNLEKYENEKKGKISLIHGDYVFTNILINQFGKIKLIDMRGKIGNNLTLFGDKLYDYAKIYQSLLGYDEILVGKKIKRFYKNIFLNHFKNKFLEIYSETDFYYLKIITGFLLYTLIPLHNNNKCIEYYNLIFDIDLFQDKYKKII